MRNLFVLKNNIHAKKELYKKKIYDRTSTLFYFSTYFQLCLRIHFHTVDYELL